MEVTIKNCLVCKLNPKAVRVYLEDMIDPPGEDYSGGPYMEDPVGPEMYAHMVGEHTNEAETMIEKLWEYQKKMIDEAM